jgi:hypothetical protein
VNRRLVIGLRLLAAIPFGLIVGSFATGVLETGLWPLLLLSEGVLTVLHHSLYVICSVVGVFCCARYWALDYPPQKF